MHKSFILDFLTRHKQELSEKYGVTKIGLFGSYARDEQREDSDIDIAVEIQSNNKFRSFFALKHFIEDNLHHKIDLGIESTLKPIAKEHILREIIYV
jgi:predicted nucleotidyltransferase